MKREDMSPSDRLILSYKEVYRELYALCFAITGSETNASNALMATMMGLGEYTKRTKALERAKSEALKYEARSEINYSFLDDMPQAPKLSDEPDEFRRIAVLRFGCGLDVRQCADIMNMKQSDVRAAISSVLSDIDAQGEAARLKRLTSICQRELKSFAYCPDTAAFSRALEQRMLNEEDSGSIAAGGRRLASSVIAFIMLLVIGFMIWTGAILLNYFRESAAIENSGSEDSYVSVQGTD